ncbi:MAG: M20 family metallopeptidase [Phototrophicales bacterium]
MLQDYFKSQQQAMIDLIVDMARIESPSHNKVAVDRMGAFIEARLQQLGADVMRLFRDEVGDILFAKWNANAPGKPILFLCHIDTVWAEGTLEHMPIHLSEDGRLYGPGTLDMKSGIALMMEAIRGLQENDQFLNRPIWALLTSDEEIGSNHSEEVIREIAQKSGLVLVMEPATPEGALKIWRKGVAAYRLHITGKASHAGGAPEQGINALIELAQQAIRLHGMNDIKNGTSVSVTMAEGGSALNVIPANAILGVDTRFLKMTAMQTVQQAIESTVPFIPGAKVEIETVHSRPPMEYDALMRATFEKAQQIGAKYGITIRGEGSGGVSDGNFTASIGIPTLDGLGPIGDGAHAAHEHVLVRSLPQRAALIAAILTEWTF